MSDRNEAAKRHDDEVLHALFEAQKALENARNMLLTVAIPGASRRSRPLRAGRHKGGLKQTIRIHERAMGRL